MARGNQREKAREKNLKAQAAQVGPVQRVKRPLARARRARRGWAPFLDARPGTAPARRLLSV